MNKDVIYIDVEDDITAIIGKVKASKSKVVALVPPKRIGVLQSAVNLHLLTRAAKQSEKHLALVTSNQSLMALAAAASIPVAKNLQSKPELAVVPALDIDDEDDVIDGGSLPIGEHAKQADGNDETKDAAMVAALAAAPKADEAPLKPKVKKSSVPNFDTFRKKLIVGGGIGVLLIAFLVWALVVAPRATVIVQAKTSSSSVNLPITATTGVTTDIEKNTLRAGMQQIKQEKTQKFTATGKKDAGSKATGTVEFSTSSFSGLGTIPAGTKLTSSSGLVFVTDSPVTLAYQGGSSASGSTGVTAAENGSKYNAATGSMSGAPEDVNANLTGPTSGGVTKMITVVSEKDIVTAKQAIADESTDGTKDELKKKFAEGSLVVDQSFDVQYTDVQTEPASGEEASEATLSTTVVYTMYGIEKSELDTFLDDYLNKQLGADANQRVYENGSKGAIVQEPSNVKGGVKATLIATAQVGPKIDDQKVKDESKGKRYGEIQQNLEAIQGVESVDVKFFPFWVSSVPNDDSRITIEFKLDESN